MGKGKFITYFAKTSPDINYIGFEKQKSIQVIPVKSLQDEYGETP
jgi:tRNA G46 methylase TrmB